MVKRTVLAVWLPKPESWVRAAAKGSTAPWERKHCVVLNLTAAPVSTCSAPEPLLLAAQSSQEPQLLILGLYHGTTYSSQVLVCTAESMYRFMMPVPCLRPSAFPKRVDPGGDLHDHPSSHC